MRMEAKYFTFFLGKNILSINVLLIDNLKRDQRSNFLKKLITDQQFCKQVLMFYRFLR